jgi:hypothetical protein
MRLLKMLVAGAAIGVIVIAFRDSDAGRWIAPPLRLRGEGGEDQDETEPVLGYDGMDVDTLLEWMDNAGADSATLERMRGYEADHLAREEVLRAIEERL